MASATAIAQAFASGGGSASAVASSLASTKAQGGCGAVAQALAQAQAIASGQGKASAFAQAAAAAGVRDCLPAPVPSPVSSPKPVTPGSQPSPSTASGCPDAGSYSPSLWYDHYADTAVPANICPNPMRRDWDPAVIHLGNGQPTMSGVVDSVWLAGPFVSVTCTRYRGFFR